MSISPDLIRKDDLTMEFIRYGWIELVELYQKNYVSNFRKVFYECQNFGSISRCMKNNGTLNCFRKRFFQNFRHSFSDTTQRALFNHNEEKKILLKF
jgi:hypothetical protein